MPVKVSRITLNSTDSTLLAEAAVDAQANVLVSTPDIVYVGKNNVTAHTGFPVGNGDLSLSVALAPGDKLFGIAAPDRTTTVAVLVS